MNSEWEARIKKDAEQQLIIEGIRKELLKLFHAQPQLILSAGEFALKIGWSEASIGVRVALWDLIDKGKVEFTRDRKFRFLEDEIASGNPQ